jgi:ArsR family transcriptional regulator
MSTLEPKCGPGEHRLPRERQHPSLQSFERAAAIFRALGDPGRLRILEMLLSGPMCVSTISQEIGDSMPAVSQRLKLLRSERLVSHRRQGKHVIYALADQHISKLVRNGLAHASEVEERVVRRGISSIKS